MEGRTLVIQKDKTDSLIAMYPILSVVLETVMQNRMAVLVCEILSLTSVGHKENVSAADAITEIAQLGNAGEKTTRAMILKF